MIKKLFYIVIALLFHNELNAQACTTLGQNPETAFPVCGTTVFRRESVPECDLGNIAVAGCGSGAQYSIKNPFWYKFTCYQAGTLSFIIKPIAANEDYDWQLYDITGRNPRDVITNQSLVVTGNWAGTYGETGASATGVTNVECGSNPADNKPTFARSPNLIQGHEYLLLVSHFSSGEKGYDLSFGGGTAVITDPKLPALQSSRAICDGTQAVVKLNKRMKCSSLSANGSEFVLTPNLANIVGAVGYGCSNGFDMDSVILTLNSPLPPGNYTISIKNGSDGNTIKDNCDREIPVGESINVVVYPVFPTPMDSIVKPACAPDKLQLVFRKPMRCNSIAANGSDFTVTGTSPVTVTGASGVCDSNGLSFVINVQLSAPIQTKGNFLLNLQTGTDGNTIIDECGQPTSPSSISFSTMDTVNADFTYNVTLGCKTDIIDYLHDGRNEVNFWKWTFDGNRNSSLQNPSIVYAVFGNKTARLIVSNGTCKDTSDIVNILLDNFLEAKFEGTNVVCPGDFATFKDTSIGNILQWNWNFGNGNISNLQQPPAQTYPYTNLIVDVPVRLIVTNNLGCSDTAIQTIKVVGNCFIAVPNAFTPNKDGLNDFLYPTNAYKARDLSFRVFNRFGQLMFSTTNWTNRWDGNFKGQPADMGTYVWMLEYTNIDTGKRIAQKGTTVLLR